MFDHKYTEQVHLLLSCMPAVADEACFALKGGTAINLFVRNMPRVSVDIDLIYLPVAPRDVSLSGIESALRNIKETIDRDLDGSGSRKSTSEKWKADPYALRANI